MLNFDKNITECPLCNKLLQWGKYKSYRTCGGLPYSKETNHFTIGTDDEDSFEEIIIFPYCFLFKKEGIAISSIKSYDLYIAINHPINYKDFLSIDKIEEFIRNHQILC